MKITKILRAVSFLSSVLALPMAISLTAWPQQNPKLGRELPGIHQAGSGGEARNPSTTGSIPQSGVRSSMPRTAKRHSPATTKTGPIPSQSSGSSRPKTGNIGGMYFGNQDFSPKAVDWHSREGGINDKGLFYDFASTEEVKVPANPNKSILWLLINKVMEECSTVDEALKLLSEYNYRDVWKGHMLIGDRFGNSAVVEPLAFIRKSRRYQVATNFLQSKTDPATSTDTRYRLASELFEQSDKISIDLFRHILDDTHMEEQGGSASVTLYSYICDLKKGDVYIYNFHNYDNVH